MATAILTRYVEAAMGVAVAERDDSGEWYAEIPACRGVWATGANRASCLDELREVLEEWLVLKLRDGDDIPSIHGADLRVEHI